MTVKKIYMILYIVNTEQYIYSFIVDETFDNEYFLSSKKRVIVLFIFISPEDLYDRQPAHPEYCGAVF